MEPMIHGPIRSDADYEAAVSSLNALLDAGAADENHTSADLLQSLGELIADYEDIHLPTEPMPGVSPDTPSQLS